MQWLTLAVVEAAAQVAAEASPPVSEVARGPGGFLEAYRATRGHPDRIAIYWAQKRAGFIQRHRAQLRQDEHADGWEPDPAGGTRPTRRHLALAVWAWSPTPVRLGKWLERKGYL